MLRTDLAVIGGGPAGMAAALAAREAGVEDILILERADRLGGILNQCIHPGFGIELFQKELTGPEYAGIYIRKARKADIRCRLSAMVTGLSRDKTVTFRDESGVTELQAGTVVLATGCRERTRGALAIPGARGAGILSAGTAQRFINELGYMPGKEIVILGSGDIGLIMARRCVLEGASVKAVCEIAPRPGGLRRNIAQCLDDFGIPLLLSHTVTRIYGKYRVSGVDISQTDENLRPVPGTAAFMPCDTLLLSVGLIPENELAQMAGIPLDGATKGPLVDEFLQTQIPGVFSCGNALHVHDIVDRVSVEAHRAGGNAARYLKGEL